MPSVYDSGSYSMVLFQGIRIRVRRIAVIVSKRYHKIQNFSPLSPIFSDAVFLEISELEPDGFRFHACEWIIRCRTAKLDDLEKTRMVTSDFAKIA